MAYCLVQFVEDDLYQVCPKNSVRQNMQEPGLVSAKYKGIFFRAVIISEGDTSYPPTTLKPLVQLRNLEVEYHAHESHENVLSAISAPFQSGNETLSSSVAGDQIRHIDAIDVEKINEDENVCMGVHIDSNEDEGEEKTEQPSKNVKKYYCPYCRALYKQLARHLFQVHGGEKDIAAIADLKKNNPERRRVLSALRAKGCKTYNALQTSPTKKIVTRTKKGMDFARYIECYLCGGMYKTKFLHRHIKICPKNDSNESSKKALKTAKQYKHMTEDNGDQAIKFSQDVLSGMREGDIKLVIENDPLLTSYGRFMCSYYGTDKHLVNLIRRKLRQLAEVLIEVKNNDNSIMSLKDIFQPSKKIVLFKAVKTVTGFEKGEFKRPAMANEMATLLKHCAKRYMTEEQEKENEDEVKQIKNWMDVMSEDYNAYIGKHARKTLDANQWNKPKTLPLTEDVMKLNKHVKEVAEEATLALETEFSLQHWTNLNKATMVKLMLFNRKRAGDVQRVTVTDFKKVHNVQKGTVTYEMLSNSEKLLCAKYKRLQARGKHGKVVSMILTNEIMRNITFLLRLREKAGIPTTNPYVFAKKGEEPFHANLALKDMAFECKAKHPEHLTGTRLRKEIATATQAFNFSLNDMTIIANFLGHTLQTHSQFYRLPDEAIQLAKISVVLEAIDSGKIAELKGKSLDELEKVIETFIDEQNPSAEQEEDEPGLPSLQPSTPRKPVKIVKKTWTTPERSIMKQYFRRHLANKTLPTPLECYEAKQRYSPIKCRTVAQIKAWVYNQHQKKKRKVDDSGV